MRTTEEQDALKQQERQAKLAAFRKLSGALQALRLAPATLSEPASVARALSLSALLLAKQPDLGSVWNFRRELLLAAFTEAARPGLCADELGFLDACLRDSPKSYGVWHHRAWILQQTPCPPWQNELDKCTFFLGLDSRNCVLRLGGFSSCIFFSPLFFLKKKSFVVNLFIAPISPPVCRSPLLGLSAFFGCSSWRLACP